MKPSSFTVEMLAMLQEEHANDAFRLCLEIESQLIQGLADELKDPAHKFQDKFQIIADLKFCSDYLEGLLDALSIALNSNDPFYELLGYVDGD